MKLLTLNLHCMEEENIPLNQERIATQIMEDDIDIIFFQEVAQSVNSPKINKYIREDNYGLSVVNLLKEMGANYEYYYEPTNLAFVDYEEGLMILSKHPLVNKRCTFVSKTQDFTNWAVRKHLRADILYKRKIITLSSIHLGWTDGVEVFEDQVDILKTNTSTNINILAGDFNVASTSKEYQYLIDSGLYDLFSLDDPENKHTPTHINDMDVHQGETRIDYIFSNRKFNVVDKGIYFKDQRVSDHYGVYLEINFD